MTTGWTLVKGEIRKVNIISERDFVYKVSCPDFVLNVLNAFRIKSEVFKTKKEAKKYFK